MSQAAAEWQLVDIRLYFHSRLKLRDISRLWHQSRAIIVMLVSTLHWLCFWLLPPSLRPPLVLSLSRTRTMCCLSVCAYSLGFRCLRWSRGTFEPTFVQYYVLPRMGLISHSQLHFLAAEATFQPELLRWTDQTDKSLDTNTNGEKKTGTLINDQINRQEFTSLLKPLRQVKALQGPSCLCVLVKTLASISSNDSWVSCSVVHIWCWPALSEIPHVWFGADLAQMRQMCLPVKLKSLNIGVFHRG